jgi:hypothetical protein
MNTRNTCCRWCDCADYSSGSSQGARSTWRADLGYLCLPILGKGMFMKQKKTCNLPDNFTVLNSRLAGSLGYREIVSLGLGTRSENTQNL